MFNAQTFLKITELFNFKMGRLKMNTKWNSIILDNVYHTNINLLFSLTMDSLFLRRVLVGQLIIMFYGMKTISQQMEFNL